MKGSITALYVVFLLRNYVHLDSTSSHQGRNQEAEKDQTGAPKGIREPILAL